MDLLRHDERILQAVDAYAVAILDHEDAIGKRAAVWRLVEGSVPAEQHRGAVEAGWTLNDAVIDLLRAPGSAAGILPQALWRAVEAFQADIPDSRGQS